MGYFSEQTNLRTRPVHPKLPNNRYTAQDVTVPRIFKCYTTSCISIKSLITTSGSTYYF